MKRILAMFLSVLMVISICTAVPFSAFASGEENAAYGRYACVSGDSVNTTLGLTDGNKTNNGESLKFQNFNSNLSDEITDASDNYLLVDLGAKYDISSVNLAGYTGVTTAAKVYFSNDPEAAIADWTYYGEMPQVQQTASGYDIEGQVLTARYVRVYVTYYRYGSNDPADNWFYLNEITVMGTLHAGETEPIRMADGDLIISPLYGRIENYQGRTSFILAVPTILGAASDENTALATALKNGTYKVVCTVTDENTGAADSFEYMPRDLSYELPGYCFRLPVTEYGYMPTPGHSFTLALAVYDGETLLYAGSSATGAFTPLAGNSASEAFLSDGAIAPKVTIDRNSSLAGKSILFVGDSITEAICERYNPDTTPIAGWPGRVGTANCMAFVNAGVSGATISLVNAWNEAASDLNGRNVIYNQLRKNASTDFDLVILHGGVNDAWCNADVGSISASDNFDRSTFDVSTYAGGLEYTFSYALETYPNAKFGFIINFALPSSTNGRTSDMTEYFTVAKAICEKWNIPYLNLYDNEEVANRLQPNTTFALGDYVHPNNRGYDILYPYVEQFVKAVDEGRDPSTLTDPAYSGPVSNGAEILASDRDVAAGKAATDSTGTASANVNDGKLSSTTSFGTCGSEDCYAQIDLGGVYDIDKVNVYCGGVNTLYKYEIQVSLNGATFTTVGAKTDDQMEFPNGYTVGFEKVSARYVRVVGKYYNKGNSSNKYAFSVGEIAVYGVINEGKTFEGKELSVITPDTVTLPKDTGTSDKLSDGNKISDPLVIGVIHGGTLTVDMTEEKALSKIVCFLAESNSAFTVLGSADGTEWTKLGSKALTDTLVSVTDKGNGISFPVSGAYRYLQICWDDSERGDGYVGLAEMEVYDAEGNLLSKAEEAEAGRTWTITSEDCVYPASGVDGNYTSYAFLKKRNAGITLDFGTASTIYKISGFVTDPRMTYQVLISEDGADYVGFGSVQYEESYEASVGYCLYGEAYARYVRIVPTGYVDDAFGMYELEVTADAHVHDYTGDWVFDEANHWKVCTAENCTEIGKKEAHTFDAGQVTVVPTDTETGIMVYTCTVCGSTKDEVLPVDPTYGQENVALNKDAWVYTQESSKTGDYSLKSASGITNGVLTDGVWIYGDFGTMYALIDLGQVYAVSGVKVTAYYSSSYSHFAQSWSVYVSEDNENFVLVASVVKEPHPEEGYMVTFETSSARYIKVVADYYVTAKQFNFREVQVFGEENSAEHVHSYGDWQTDETNHWKQCTGCDQIVEEGAHTFDEGVVTTPATETEEGVKTYTCTVCGKTKTETLRALNNLDISSGKNGWIYTKPSKTDTEYSRVSKNALTDGLKNDNWAFGEFGEMYALVDLGELCTIREVNVIAYAPYRHAWSVYVSEDDVTYTKVASVETIEHPVDGITVSFDAVAARYVKVVADYYVTPQQFSFREVTVYGKVGAEASHEHTVGDWQTDADNHWKVCAECGELVNKEAHTFDDGVITTPATDTAEGVKTYTCTVCGYEKTETIPIVVEKTNVAFGKDAWIYTQESSKTGSYSLKTTSGITNGVLTDNTWAYGTFGEFYALIDLGESCIISSVNVVAYAPYNHAWSVYVSTDGVAYSKVAAVDTQAHPAEGVTVNFDEVSARYVRIVADYYVTPQQFSFREVEVYGVVGGGDTHEHTYGDWQTDADNHWKVCTECGESTAKVAHTFDSGVVTTPATGTSEGVMTYTCSACGYEKTEPIPMTDGLTEVSTSEQGATVTLGNGSTNTDLINGVTDSNYTLIAEGENCYAVIDLQQNYDLKRVNVYLYNFNYGFDIYGSTDGETWTKLGSNTVDSAVYNKDDGYAIEVSGSYRYVKVVGTSYQYGYFTVYEINVFADLNETSLKGDVDGDGIVSISDVAALLDYLADNANVPACGEDGLDVDGDETVNISDVTALLDILSSSAE